MEPTDRNNRNDRGSKDKAGRTKSDTVPGKTSGMEPVIPETGTPELPGAESDKGSSAPTASPHGAVIPSSSKSPVPDSLPAEAVAASGVKESEAPAKPEGKPEPVKTEGVKTDSVKTESPKPESPKPENPKPSGKDKVSGGSNTPPKPPRGDSSNSGGSGKGLSALALLVALAALGLSGWQWYEGQEAATDDQAETLDARFEALSASQQESVQQAVQQSRSLIDERLENVPQASDVQQVQRMASDLQRSQQAMTQRLDTLQGEARSDWKLAEAEYLLRLASLRLMAAQDVRSARELLNAVDEILREEPDSGVFTVREQLARVEAELENLPEVDRPGIYLRLAALNEQVDRIVALPVQVYDPDEVSVEEDYEDRLARRTRLERVLIRLERYVRVDFQRGKVITPQLDEAEMQRLRRTLQLTIEQAQWAALRGEQEVFTDSLQQAEGVLRRFFEMDNPQVRTLQMQLNNLSEQEVALSPPDLSPLQRGLAAYIQSRRSNGAQGGAASNTASGGIGAVEQDDQETGNE